MKILISDGLLSDLMLLGLTDFDDAAGRGSIACATTAKEQMRAKASGKSFSKNMGIPFP
ncbi:MAG: hypothetical protein P8L85_19675 [Rubripirellula sp.]|nr:hypothetical protein [Rubripirellula sp.]